MGLLDRFKKKNKEEAPVGPYYLYDEKEIEELDAYLQQALGDYKNVFHEMVSPDIHCDIALLDPTEEAPYWKLVTMGAGAYRMNVPTELAEYQLEYAEYIIYLPSDWNLGSNEENDYWPIRTLKDISRLPIYCDTWLGYGHTIQANAEGTPYASNTKFNNTMLVNAITNEGKRMQVQLSSGKVVNFYLLLPIYQEELEFKQEKSADELVDLLSETDVFPVLDIQRKNVAL